MKDWNGYVRAAARKRDRALQNARYFKGQMAGASTVGVESLRSMICVAVREARRAHRDWRMYRALQDTHLERTK